MCPDCCRIHEDPFLIVVQLEVLEDSLPVALLSPAAKSSVDGLPLAEALGKVTPWNACFQPVQYGVDEIPVAESRVRSSEFRENELDHLPLGVGQGMSLFHTQV
jgi:hypothetical protein